jgi:hypothetical protein
MLAANNMSRQPTTIMTSAICTVVTAFRRAKDGGRKAHCQAMKKAEALS